MIYVTGDSHAGIFVKIDGVKVIGAHQVTLKRVGNPEDNIIPKIIEQMNPSKNDIVIFYFGEIDIRCYVYPTLEHRQNTTLESLLDEWASNYTDRIASLNLNEADIGIVSIPPPSRKATANSFRWPIGGTLEERVIYTKKINELLEKQCQKRNWYYLDIYSKYADFEGALPENLTDNTVHINNNIHVKKIIEKIKKDIRSKK